MKSISKLYEAKETDPIKIKSLKDKLSRIEKSIDKNRELLRNGGDKTYYTKQILNLNALANEIENKL